VRLTTPTSKSSTPKASAAPNPDAAICVEAHKHASKHRTEIEASETCGCFFCFRKFAPTAIKEWCDGKQTALCPGCGVDAVLGSASTFRLDDTFLRTMHRHYFSYRSK